MCKKLPGCELSSLSEYTPAIFVSSNPDNQKMCNFMLALASVYNDYKNVLWGLEQIGKCEEEKEAGGRTPYNGQLRGFRIYLMKLALSIPCELLELISRNEDLIESEHFVSFSSKMLAEQKKDWDFIVATARGQDGATKGLLRYLKLIRNNIGFHYSHKDSGLKILGAGFVRAFYGVEKQTMAVSRSDWMSKSRFHFADAAIEGVILEEGFRELTENISGFTDVICRLLYSIVTLFIDIEDSKQPGAARG